MDKTNTYNLKDKLIEFGKNIPKDIIENDAKERIKDPNTNSLEFIFGVILDQGINYERAWSAPYELKKRLGHLDVKKIAEMDKEELKK